METYRLKSKLVQCDKEFVIQTGNDTNRSAVLSTVYVDGQAAERVERPHPEDINPEEVLSLVKATHQEQKHEIEMLLSALGKTLEGANMEMMYHLGTTFFYKRLYHEARELFQAAIALNPDDHQALNRLGMTQLALNMAAEAVESGTAAVQKQPTYADYRNNLGESLLAANSCGRAIEEFQEAIKINLYYADAYFNLGLAYILDALNTGGSEPRADLPGKADDCFKKASLIHADYDAGLMEEGLSALRRSDLRQAYSVLLREREAKKEKHRREFAVFYMKYVMHPDWVSEEVVGDRIRFLQAEIGKNPTYVDLYTELGLCLLQQARLSWQKGIEQYKMTLELNPSLNWVQDCLHETEKELQNISSVLNGIVGKNQ